MMATPSEIVSPLHFDDIDRVCVVSSSKVTATCAACGWAVKGAVHMPLIAYGMYCSGCCPCKTFKPDEIERAAMEGKVDWKLELKPEPVEDLTPQPMPASAKPRQPQPKAKCKTKQVESTRPVGRQPREIQRIRVIKHDARLRQKNTHLSRIFDYIKENAFFDEIVLGAAKSGANRRRVMKSLRRLERAGIISLD